MSPILGIWASGQQPALATAFESIATVTVGAGGSSTIDFSSIPSTYKHLQLRGLSRSSYSSGSPAGLFIRFNSDTGSNYAYHSLWGDGASANTGASSSVTFGQVGQSTTATNASSIFSVSVIDILDYANTSKYKTVRDLNGFDANGSGQVWLASSLWQSTSAINGITLLLGAGSFVQYSSFALYGIK